MVLAHAGHGNYLGLQSCLTGDGAADHDLRADHEALFMQIAAIGGHRCGVGQDVDTLSRRGTLGTVVGLAYCRNCGREGRHP
jgi:hypothetical protein